MNNPDELINQFSHIVRDASRPYSCAVISMHNTADYLRAGLLSQEFIDYFSANSFGESETYKWETRRVDQIVNLKIWKINNAHLGFTKECGK